MRPSDMPTEQPCSLETAQPKLAVCRYCGGVPTIEAWKPELFEECPEPKLRHSIWCFGEGGDERPFNAHHHNEVTTDDPAETAEQWNLANRPSPDSAVRGALEEIKNLEPEPIGDTGFQVGPAALLQRAKRIAADALSAPSRKDGEADGETAAIIAWLRNPAGKGTEDWADAAEHFAWCIENGQHRAVLSNAGADA